MENIWGYGAGTWPPALCFSTGPWPGCVVRRGNAVSAMVLLLALSLSGRSGQSS